MVFAVLVLHFSRANALTQERYLLLEYEKKLEEFSNENETLEINLSKSKSLSNVENHLLNDNFVKATEVKYIQILEGSVVAK
jgi:hypothetical protein